ncbi:MAG: fumarylacetoacetate hydrolase family protein [Sphingomonadales bacterium]
MRLVTFEMPGDRAGAAHVGLRQGDRVVDLSLAAPNLPGDLAGLLAAGPEALAAARKAAEQAPAAAIQAWDDLRLLPPIPRPGKILCLGLNYHAHAAEGGREAPDYPNVFMRGATSLVAHKQAMILPKASHRLDYEVELAVIVGTRARHLTAENALDCVGGYACFNDGSVRDYQRRAPQWTMGKNFDATGGFGPECVTPDELPPGGAGLRIQTRLNGQTMQDSNTDKMIFNVVDTLVALTEVMTLEPGDVIATGTCEGVGFARKPPVWMKDGDVCEVEIEGVGTLVNPIQAE